MKLLEVMSDDSSYENNHTKNYKQRSRDNMQAKENTFAKHLFDFFRKSHFDDVSRKKYDKRCDDHHKDEIFFFKGCSWCAYSSCPEDDNRRIKSIGDKSLSEKCERMWMFAKMKLKFRFFCMLKCSIYHHRTHDSKYNTSAKSHSSLHIGRQSDCTQRKKYQSCIDQITQWCSNCKPDRSTLAVVKSDTHHSEKYRSDQYAHKQSESYSMDNSIDHWVKYNEKMVYLNG